jgi:hypothetical protein
MAEETTMSRKKSLAKKRPEEVRVNWVVDLVDPPQPVVDPAGTEPAGTEPEPQPEPAPQPTEEWLSGVGLANALKIATAECARLATDRAAAEARVRELEAVLKQMDSFVSSALQNGDSA